jgi:tRNA(fMet)-specific endonuclease VapC
MNVYVFDTDILSLWQHGHEAVSLRSASHADDELAVTVITVQEQLDGWHSRLCRAKDRRQIAGLYQRLADNVQFLSRLKILPFSEEAIDRYDNLQKQKLNMGKMDLRIAAIVLEFGFTLITRNTQDFCRVPGLKIEDWSK